MLTWLGLGLMSLQFGVLARLTWWEYSWDIMEPVTYFVTYGTAIAGYAYFVMTRQVRICLKYLFSIFFICLAQEFMYEPAKGRHSLLTFHRKASKHRWDVARCSHSSPPPHISGHISQTVNASITKLSGF